MDRFVGVRIDDNDAVLAQSHVFGMANLMHFATRKPDLKRFERGAVQPCTNRLHVHLGILPPQKIKRQIVESPRSDAI